MNPFLFDQYNLPSVTSVFTAAAPLGRDLSERLHRLQPNWKFVHGYGTSPLCFQPVDKLLIRACMLRSY